MGSLLVVVGDEAIAVGLELGHGVGGLLGEELLERLVEPFDLAAGLGVVGTRVFESDTERFEQCFDHDFAVAVFRGAAVEERGGCAVAGGRAHEDLGDVSRFGDRQCV
jgi:hypothetical protein